VAEQVLGTIIDRSHTVAPEALTRLLIEELGVIGVTDLAVYLQDYDQELLLPLTSEGLVDREPEPIEGSVAGRAFTTDSPIERVVDEGVRIWLPMLDGTERVGVLALTLPHLSEDDGRLLRRIAGLVANLIVLKGAYSDLFFLTRRRQPMSLAAEMQWRLLPPLTITTPRVSIAGAVEPPYAVGGDAFDYALNGDLAEFAIVDAMGHGLRASLMATASVSSYRHSRRARLDLPATYRNMDAVVAQQFGEDHFVTAQLATLQLDTGLLRWVNAGHPAPLLIRGRRVVRELQSSVTLPVGIGGADPEVAEEALQPGDRVLFYTDGVIEERVVEGEQFGRDRMVDLLLREIASGLPVGETVRRTSRTLLRHRGGTTTDDATIVLVEWRGREPENGRR